MLEPKNTASTVPIEIPSMFLLLRVYSHQVRALFVLTKEKHQINVIHHDGE